MPRTPSAEARTKVLKAAARLLLRDGVYRFTVDAVVDASGVAKTTIYRHFASKNELIAAAVDHQMPVPITPDTGSLRTDLMAFLESVRPIFADADVRNLWFDLWSIARHEPELARLHDQVMAGRTGPTLAIYQQGLARGEIDPAIDYATTFEIIEGPFIVRSLTRPDALYDYDLDTLVGDMVAMLAPATGPDT